MEINPTSWHFRAIKYAYRMKAYDYQQWGTTLCGYFWSVFFACLTIFAKLLVVFFILWLLVYNPISYLWAPTVEKLMIAIIWGCALGFAVFAFGGMYLIQKYRSWSEKRPVKKQKQPNILVEYIKARKEKFCPIVKIVDPNKKD